MTERTSPAPPDPRRRWGRGGLAAVGLLVVFGGVVLLYGMGGIGKKAPAECRAAADTVARLDPLIHGEVAALALSRPVRLVPALSFAGPDGSPKTLADFKGRTVLLNLWATWCVPCRKEMPALDKLQAKLGGADFQVVAVNIDTARLDRPKAFLHDTGVTSLPLYTDATANVFQVLRQDGQALGLPTTLLVDRNGCELGAMAGPAEWDSPDAEKLIEAAKQS
jgi:thiol-disulfide isomerase/thioredoxin